MAHLLPAQRLPPARPGQQLPRRLPARGDHGRDRPGRRGRRRGPRAVARRGGPDVEQGDGGGARARRGARRRRLGRGLAVRAAIGRRVRARRADPQALRAGRRRRRLARGGAAPPRSRAQPERPAVGRRRPRQPRGVPRAVGDDPGGGRARRRRPRRPALGARRALAAQARRQRLAALQRARRDRRSAGAAAARVMADLVPRRRHRDPVRAHQLGRPRDLVRGRVRAHRRARPPQPQRWQLRPVARHRRPHRRSFAVRLAPAPAALAHPSPNAGTFVLSRGTADLIVDPSPYGSLSTLTGNAPAIRSRQLPGPYQPSQGAWASAVHWRWATRSAGGVVAARCDYSDAFRFQDHASDVLEALRDFVLLPSPDGRDAQLVIVDRATTGDADRNMYLRFRVPGELSLDRGTGTAVASIRGARLAIHGTGGTLAKTALKDCFQPGTERGNCDAARIPVTDYRAEIPGPAPRTVHVLDATGPRSEATSQPS